MSGLFNVGKFGDGNIYTIFSHDLKSVLTQSDLNGLWTFFSRTGSGLDPLVSERGTRFVDVNGVGAGYYFQTIANSIVNDLDKEGHIKIKCERDWVCVNDTTFGSTGTALDNSQTIISGIAAGASALGSMLSKFIGTGNSALAGLMNVQIRQSYFNNEISSADVVAKLFTHGKADDIDIDIFWKGRYAFFMVDGLIVNATDKRVSTVTGLFDRPYLGSDRGIASSHCVDHWFSNYEIRTKCPEFSLNYSKRAIGVLSDSLFDSADITYAPAGDVTPHFRMQRTEHSRSQYLKITMSENGGYRTVQTAAANVQWLGYASTVPDAESNTPIVSSLANNPIKTLISGGTNDAILAGDTITDQQFEDACIDILEKHLGENGNAATKVEMAYWLVPIPLWGYRNNANYAASIIKAARFRVVLLNLPNVWNAKYPSRTGAVKILDSFNALGGLSDDVANDLYVGQLEGTLSNLHLAAHGLQIWGDFIDYNL